MLVLTPLSPVRLCRTPHPNWLWPLPKRPFKSPNTMPSVPFPEVLDSTLIAAFRSCPQKFYRTYMEHWKPKTPSVHLHAGAAYAAALEVARIAFFTDGKSPDEARALGMQKLITVYGDFECPPDSAKSLERMCGALDYYLESWPLERDPAKPILLPSGKRGVEFSFNEPIDAANPETGNPILYCGRMDTVVDFAGGTYGEDDKTTSQLGASWSKQWDLRSQFTGYCWGAKKGGIPLNGFLIRGVSILKKSYDRAEAITYRPQWMIDRWYDQLLRDVKRIRECWESGMWDYNLDHACAEYGGCDLRQVCLSDNPQPWLEINFERRRWDPVKREETVL